MACPLILPNASRGESGFSLIELMVVVFIIGLAAGAVVITIAPAERAAIDDAERFAARAAAARDLAVIERRPIRLWVTGSGYGFENRAGAEWLPSDEDILETRDWSSGTAATLSGGDQARRVFGFTGLPSAPLAVTLAQGQTHATVRIEGSGKVSVDAR